MDVKYGPRKITQSEYDDLREQTPNNRIRDKVNENFVVGQKDPAIPGKIVDKRLEADHIVSMDRITRMNNFYKLSYENKLKVLNYEKNFVGNNFSTSWAYHFSIFILWSFINSIL